MASYKKKGSCNIVALRQGWKQSRTGRVWEVVQKGKRGKDWVLSGGKMSHHIGEGTLLKFFERIY